MKTNHYIKSTYIAIIALAMAINLQAQNLLVNGDFEATVAPFGWTKNNGDILLNEKNAYSIHPDKDENDVFINGNCRMPGLAAVRFITQSVDITTAGTYTFKFTTRIQNGAPFLSGDSPNNHATLGPATVTGEIFPFEADGTTVGTTALATITTQSNTNTDVSTSVTIAAEVTKVQVKISKNWNVPYIDDVLFYLNGTLGVAKNDIENLKIYSNDGSLFVSSSSQLNHINIYNTSGSLIRTIKTENNTSDQISIGNLAKGLYIIRATDKDGKTGALKHLIK